jgi:hypothetical protein
LPRALNLLRSALHYRRDAFSEGLRAAGYDVQHGIDDPEPGDLLLIWNRYAGFNELACMWERRGALVVVAENGWLGKGWRGGDWYAISLRHHSGAGEWANHGPSRWDGWNVDLAPWRTGGREVLVLGQRGIGEPGIRSPDLWAEDVASRAGGARVRPHPGMSTTCTPLAADLESVSSVLTWHSGAALVALTLGVPVFYGFKHWIGAQAGLPLEAFFRGEQPLRDDDARRAMFHRLAWSMWTLDEVRTGVPFPR